MLVELHCIDNAQEDLVGPAAASDVRHARVPHLRRADDPARVDRDRRAGAGDHRQAVSASRAQPRLPPLPPRADRREQVARRALGHRRQADRLRQAREVPMRELALELLEFVDDVVDDLGSRREVEYVQQDPGGRHQRRAAAAGLPGDRRPARGRAVARRRNARGEQSETIGAEHELCDRLSTMKVGLLCGREYSFPPAFLDRVNTLGRPHGITAEFVKLDRHEDGRAVRLPRHRRSHLARGGVLPRLSEARGARGHLRHQQPVLVDGRRQVLQLLGRAAARRRRAEDRACCRRRRIRRTST